MANTPERSPEVSLNFTGAVLLVPDSSTSEIPSSELELALKKRGYETHPVPIIGDSEKVTDTLDAAVVKATELRSLHGDNVFSVGVGENGVIAAQLAILGITEYATVLNAPVKGFPVPKYGATSLYSTVDKSGNTINPSDLFRSVGADETPVIWPYHNPGFTNIPVFGVDYHEFANSSRVGELVVWSLDMHRAEQQKRKLDSRSNRTRSNSAPRGFIPKR